MSCSRRRYSGYLALTPLAHGRAELLATRLTLGAVGLALVGLLWRAG
ncbi:MAG: hypothetical protein AB1445_04400 [Bacillota bacterium]